MTDESRANRLRQKRRQAKQRAEPDEPAESDELSEPDEKAEPNEPSVKEAQVGTYMYLPKEQKREMEHVYTVLKAEYEYEFDEDFEKNRHFFPLVVKFGLDRLDGSSASAVQALLDEL